LIGRRVAKKRKDLEFSCWSNRRLYKNTDILLTYIGEFCNT
jgi:hypothetical protein